MTIGILNLISVGKENMYLSTMPDITYFKIAYKRYTNFSSEMVAQYFKTTPDFGRRVTVNISKNADLLNRCYVYVNLPDIINSNHSVLPSGIKKFAWSKKIGLALLRYVDLEIGGVLIERNFGDWLNIWYELTTGIGKRPAYNKLIGDIELLTSYTDGKKSYTLNIPLNFWFCTDSGLTLPLLCMIHNDIKVHVEFNNFSICYLESPTNYINITDTFCLFQENEIITQTINNVTNIGQFVYFDYQNQNIYYNKIQNDFVVNTKYPLIGSITNFQTTINLTAIVIQDESYFQYNQPSLLDAYLLVNFIYLDNEERFNFINRSHQYLIPIVQNVSQQNLTSVNSSYKIPLNNPNKIIFWRCNLNSIRDSFNYNLLNGNPIIEKVKLILNSIDRMEIYDSIYYTNLQIYLNNFVSSYNNNVVLQNSIIPSNNGINMFSFSLNPMDYNPSGSFNFSEIDDMYLQFTLNKSINYQNTVNVVAYSLEYNTFKISDGLGNLGYVV